MKQQQKAQQNRALDLTTPKQTPPFSTSKKNHLITNSTFQSQSYLSLTENEIYSHELIKNVMAQHKNITIHHQINQISPQTILNAEPKDKIKQEFNFTTIPPNNKFYQSVFSSKIRRITQKLARPISNRRNKSQMVKTTDIPNPSSNKRNKISVSGLVTYNFKSINAGRSVGYNKINYEQKLKQDQEDVQRRTKCKSMIRDKILQNGPLKRYQRIKQTEQMILSNKELNTQHYLKRLIKEKKENQRIYDQKYKNLEYIKEMMGQMNKNYDDSEAVVNKIEKACEKKDKLVRKRTVKTEVDEQHEIMHRKVPYSRKKVIIREITFVD